MEQKDRRSGISLRHFFAAHALQGLIAKYGISPHDHPIVQHSADAYAMADEMIKHAQDPSNKK